jgi:hypothetical protein
MGSSSRDATLVPFDDRFDRRALFLLYRYSNPLLLRLLLLWLLRLLLLRLLTALTLL